MTVPGSLTRVTHTASKVTRGSPNGQAVLWASLGGTYVPTIAGMNSKQWRGLCRLQPLATPQTPLELAPRPNALVDLLAPQSSSRPPLIGCPARSHLRATRASLVQFSAVIGSHSAAACRAHLQSSPTPRAHQHTNLPCQGFRVPAVKFETWSSRSRQDIMAPTQIDHDPDGKANLPLSACSTDGGHKCDANALPQLRCTRMMTIRRSA
jgi:hypothetical protein